MGTTTEKLTYLQGTKDAIKNAIVAKGVEVPEGTTFRGYAEKVGEIKMGGTPEWKTISVSGKKEGKMTSYEIKIPIGSKNQSVIIYRVFNGKMLCYGISTASISDGISDTVIFSDASFSFIERTNEMVTFIYSEIYGEGDKDFIYVIV